MASADFKNVTIKGTVGVFDSLSSNDEVGAGNYRLVKNAVARATRNRQRGGGWRRLFADDEPYGNADLHDQLIDLQSYYGSYVGHAMGGGDQSGLGYPYQYPATTIPAHDVFPPAAGPYCPAYYPDYGESYGGCDIFYPFVGYPYVFHTPIPGACNTGYPFYFPFSYLYASCPTFIPEQDIESYPYGYSFPVYSPEFAYDYIYCGDDTFFRPGCREAITALGELVLSTGRKLFAATMSRVYEYNQSSGSWRILADGLGNSSYTALQCTCNSVRGIFARFGSYLIFSNNFDPVLIYLLGSDPNECSQQAMQPITDLLALGITRAGGAIEWKGFLFIWDYEENGERKGGDVRWSDFEDPNSFIESDTSEAGFGTIGVGETILNAAPLGNWLIFYTDKSMIRVSLVGGEDVFNFERIYTGSQSTGDALKYKFSLINAGDMHLYLGESDLWAFTQFDTRPVMVPWITKACGMIFLGITEDDATYERINEEMCNLVTGGYNERTKEAYLSWPSGDNACPDVTLRFNLKFSTADLVDHGFTAFQTFRKELRPTFGQWLEDLGVCERGTQVAIGPRDGPICPGSGEEVVNPPLYMRNPTEDADLPVHPDSLCARLQGKTLDDFCRDCAAPATFIMASATDFTLKQAEDDIYYRERLAFQPAPCATIEFTAESTPEPPQPEAEDMPLHSAVYDPTRGKIFAVRGGRVFKFNETTLAKENEVQYAGPTLSDSYIEYDAVRDKLWVTYSPNFNAPPGNTSPTNDKYIYKLNPDNLAFEQTIGVLAQLITPSTQGYMCNHVIRNLRSNDVQLAFHITQTGGSNGGVWIIFDPDNLPGNVWTRSNTASRWGTLAPHPSTTDWQYVDDDSYNDGVIRRTNAAVFVESGGGYPVIGSNANTKRIYGFAFVASSNKHYCANRSNLILKLDASSNIVGTAIDLVTAIDVWNIRLNPNNGLLYAADFIGNQIAVINPADDSFVLKGGFDAPWDVVFTSSKAIAIQHSAQGLKEIV
jgi:hypothetical protein